MLILGKNKDETGTNLEKLTKRLLEHFKHQNITTNFIGSGGQEIDVVSDFTIPLPGGSKTQRVICECKAHRDPVDISDWLKFLGKIYAEEAKLGAEVTGLFIALSGVNGNVSGNFDDLKAKGKSVRLVTGAELHTELSKVYAIKGSDQVLTDLKSQTNRRHVSIDLAYHDEKCFWVVTFPDQAYTVLDAAGAVLGPDEAALIRPLVEKRLAVKTYVDLQQETKRNERILQLSKLTLEILFQSAGEAPHATLIPADLGYSPEEVAEAIEGLLGLGLVQAEEHNIVLSCARGENRAANFARCVLFLFKGQVLVETISRAFLSDFFKAQMSDEFLNYVSEVQKGLVLPADDRAWIAKVLGSSPSALAYALIPDPLIVTHRDQQQGVGDEMTESNDYSTFKRKILDGLANDFAQAGLRQFYLEGLGIVEIETVKQFHLKSSTEIVTQQEVIERYGLAKTTPELGGGIIHVLIFNEAPQPWEPGGIGFKGGPPVDSKQEATPPAKPEENLGTDATPGST